MKDRNVRIVLEGETHRCLERFDPSQTEEKIKYYESLGKWSDIGVDSDGDIILW